MAPSTQTQQVQSQRPPSIRKLLRSALHGDDPHPPVVHHLHIEHIEAMLKSPLGRDFTLITAVGVEFQVHSTMLIGGSEMLQEEIWPNGNLNPIYRASFVNLPPAVHPAMVDRLVSFIYKSTYALDKGGMALHLYHATYVPAPNPLFSLPKPGLGRSAFASYQLNTNGYGIPDMPAQIFHLHMYALGETLSYPALLIYSHSRLADLLLTSGNVFSPASMREVVDAAFAPLGSPKRICANLDGTLRELSVAAVIVQEIRGWNRMGRKRFKELMVGQEYEGFWSMYDKIKTRNGDLVQAEEKKRAAWKATQDVKGRESWEPKLEVKKKSKEHEKKAKIKQDENGKGKGDGDGSRDTSGAAQQKKAKVEKGKQQVSTEEKKEQEKKGVTRVQTIVVHDEDGDTRMEIG